MPQRYGGLRPAVLTYVVLAGAVLAGIAVSGAQPTLSLRDVDEAIQIGQSRIQADRTRFHQPYRVLAGQAPVDYVEVITPFRRVVLAAEGRAQIGDRGFGQKKALELVALAEGRFDFNVEMTFHPLNTYVTMPEYEVALARPFGSAQGALSTVEGRGTTRIPAVLVERQPRYGARVEGLPPPLPTQTGPVLPGRSQPMLGGTVIAQFAGDTLDLTGPMDLVVSEAGKELVRVRINLGRLR